MFKTVVTLEELRNNSSTSSPAEEDSRLFTSGPVDIEIELAPLTRVSSRNDFVCVGFIGQAEIEVIIAGRRRAAVTPLVSKLDWLARKAKKNDPSPTALLDARCRIRAMGSWRKVISEESMGLLERRHQFLVARWKFVDIDGIERSFGAAPEQ